MIKIHVPLMVAQIRLGERDREFGIDIYLKWVTNKDLLYNTGNSAQAYVAAWMGGELGEKGYTCGYD